VPDAQPARPLPAIRTIFWRAAENRYVIEQGMAPPTTPGNCVGSAAPVGEVVTAPDGRRHRYRVSIIGFTANRQTNDGLQEWDGKGDEVYILAITARFQSNGSLISHTLERSVLMGDVNNRPAGEERLQAGGLSDRGGIGNNYSFRPTRNPPTRFSKPTLPWVVYEGELTTGFDALMVIPSIWEWDGDDRELRQFRNVYFGPVGSPRFFYDRSPNRSDWVTQLVRQSVTSPTGVAPNSAWGQGPVMTVRDAQFWLGWDGDRPIGLDLPTVGHQRVFVPKVLFLTDQLAQRVVTMRFPLPSVRTTDGNVGTLVEPGTLPPGVVPISYAGTDEGTGDYTLFLKVEQIP
jgi:hypothetical protein